MILFSQGFEFGAKTGKIKSLNLNTSEVVTLNIRNEPNREEFLAGIHGITYWRDPKSGQENLLVALLFCLLISDIVIFHVIDIDL
jgi:hypothetical protein